MDTARVVVSQRWMVMFLFLYMHYLVVERGKKIKHYVDRHELGLFDVDRTLDIMRAVGFEAWYLADDLMKDRGLYIAKKH